MMYQVTFSNKQLPKCNYSYNMNNKKAAKLIIKRAKQNPNLYAKSEVVYAKLIKKREQESKPVQ